MKLFKYMFIGVAASALLVACSDDDDNYTVGSPAAGGEEVYFSEDLESNLVLSLEDKSFSMTLVRSNAGAALSVPVSVVTTAEGIFNAPGTVEFAAGVKEATFEIAVTDAMKPFVTYSISVIVPEEYTNPYKENSVYPRADFSVLKEDYTTAFKGVYYCDFFEEEWESEIQYSELLDNYRLSDWITPGYRFTFTWDKTDNTLVFDEAKNATGYEHDSYGMVYANYDKDEDFSYDPDEKVFYFPFEWTVSAGSLGPGLDTFTVTE